MELVFLGTGAGNGVPAFYCGCRVCREAADDSRCRRTRCALAAIGEENIVIDAPPELSAQLLREKISHLDCLFLTHAHYDHCAGLGDLEIYTRFHRHEKLPVIMSGDTRMQLERSNGEIEEWMNIRLMDPGDTVGRPGIEVTAVDVSHCPGALGYIIGRDDCKVAYLPDTGPLPARTRELLSGIDVLILDTTFYGNNWYPETHLSFEETLNIAEELDVGTLFLTHLSMHHSQPITCREIEHLIRPYMGRVKLAYDGLRISLGEISEKEGNFCQNGIGMKMAG